MFGEEKRQRDDFIIEYHRDCNSKKQLLPLCYENKGKELILVKLKTLDMDSMDLAADSWRRDIAWPALRTLKRAPWSCLQTCEEGQPGLWLHVALLGHGETDSAV